MKPSRHLHAVDTPRLRFAVPQLDDFAYLARGMRSDEVQQFLAMTGASEYRPDVCARACSNAEGEAYVLIDQTNRPVMAGGFQPVRPGVLEMWAIGTPSGWDDHWRAITLICNRLLTNLLRSGQAHRIQTVSLASRTHTHEWYRRGLKMKPEGTHPQYFADRQDGITYARTA